MQRGHGTRRSLQSISDENIVSSFCGIATSQRAGCYRVETKFTPIDAQNFGFASPGEIRRLKSRSSPECMPHRPELMRESLGYTGERGHSQEQVSEYIRGAGVSEVYDGQQREVCVKTR